MVEGIVRVRLGLIGLGRMGSAMAERLLGCDVDLVVHDTDRAARDGIADRGATAVASPAHVADACATVLLALPDSPAVEAVVEGPDGLLTGEVTGRLVVDLSSSRPESTRRLHQVLGDRDASLVDAPVSRGVPAARTGDLSVFVGGDATAVEQALPALQLLGSDIVVMGGAGAGHAAKALNNLLNATSVLSACEVLVGARRAGLDIDAFVAAVNVSSGRSYATEVKLPRHILSGSFDSGFSTALMAKDVAIAVDMLRDCGVAADVGAVVNRFWQDALDELGLDGDHTTVLQLIERDGP